MPPQLAQDIEILRGYGYDINVVPDGSRFLIIFKGFRLPDGKYVPAATDLMMIADYQYPMSRLDMFWTDPPVHLTSGPMPEKADNFEAHGGRQWQRWSWHYGVWDPSKHNIRTHLEVFLDRLARGK